MKKKLNLINLNKREMNKVFGGGETNSVAPFKCKGKPKTLCPKNSDGKRPGLFNNCLDAALNYSTNSVPVKASSTNCAMSI